jgi:hypothetical protein
MDDLRLYASLTRIAPLKKRGFVVRSLPRNEWATGDYVVGRVREPPRGYSDIEVPSGRMVEVAEGMEIVGALGTRHATLEVTGTWEAIGDDGRMEVLTSAGLFGRMTSTSPYAKQLIALDYRGHVLLDGDKATMRRFVAPAPHRPFAVPTVLMTGTSMSAGKTTAAKVIIRQLRKAGLRVLGAKLTGAGRYRDILHMADAGANTIFDFVDVGLPSTVYPEAAYGRIVQELLSKMAAADPDVAVVEIGASPLEPYNGAAAIDAIQNSVQCTVLAASDPYAVYGVMHAFGMQPDVVTGIAANTQAGVELIEALCDVPALNATDPDAQAVLRRILTDTLDVALPVQAA